MDEQPVVTPTAEQPHRPIPVSSEEWEKLKAFVALTDADCERARSLLTHVEPQVDAIVDSFYDQLRSTARTAAILDENDIELRLKASQARYLRSLLGGEYGDAYLKDRLRVGATHEAAGLELRWYLGAYSIYLRELQSRLAGRPDPASDMLTIAKLMILDSQLISESYVSKVLQLLREQRDDLAETVVAQTEQLSSWERLAAIGSMSAKVAHEIRNPISSLSLNTELLADEIQSFTDQDTAEALELLNSIAGELARLNRLVQEYLQFARMPKVTFGVIDLVDLVESVLRLLDPEFDQANIDVHLRVADPDVSYLVEGDRTQLRQVLLNLLRNAREAMPGGGEVLIDLQETPSKDDIVLSIQDTGTGFGTHDIETLFDPFFTTKDTGTGLGLPFVQQVTREHGGRVVARSVEPRGARFELHLIRASR